MITIAWLMLAAALLPPVTALIAKVGGKGFNNNAPREWLAKQQGWRARAHAAQNNAFEALPFFYAAVLLALIRQVDPAYLDGLVGIWLALRVAYLGLYIAGQGMLRSLCWAAALAVNAIILFAGL